MTFAAGDAVEVKVGGSLGRWVPGVVVEKYGEEYLVSGCGMKLPVPESKIRSPRRSNIPTVATRPKRTKARRVDNVGRGPLRYPNYLKWVKAKPCIFCGRKADDPHHVGSKGLSQQTDDTKVVAVCRQAHDALHHRRPFDLCESLAYLRYAETAVGTAIDVEHSWAVVEAHLGMWQAKHITEFLRFHGGVMS